MIPVQPDVTNARAGHESIDSLDHPEPARRIGTSVSFFPLTRRPSGPLEWRFDRRRLEREIARRLVGHQHRDLVDELLEDLRRRLRDRAECVSLCCTSGCDTSASSRTRGVVSMAREATNFAPMKEYQAVILRLTRHTREDEDALTDLFNERMRSGWEPAMMSQDEQRLTIIFQRETDTERS